MSGEPQTGSGLPRLNPFILPANTHSRFALLIISILGASLFIYQSLYNAMSRAEFRRFALQCSFDKACFEPYEQRQALWMIACVGGLIVVTMAIYWVAPWFIVRRWDLTPLNSEDAPDLVNYLLHLCRQAEISRPPKFLLEALNPFPRALVFGHYRQYSVLLSGGLVTQFSTDRPIFRAVLLHELAHLRNSDVDETYFTVVVWYVFLIAAFVPFMISLGAELIRFGLGDLGFVFGVAWRGSVLAMMVFLFRNTVLRAREFYADVQSSVWDGPAGALPRALAAMPSLKSHWQTIWQAHPQPSQRRLVLTETYRLLQMGIGEAIGAGVAVAVAYENTKACLMLLLPTPQESFAFLGGTLLFAPFVIGVVGLGVWRSTFAALARHETLRGAGRLGLGFGLGFIMGQFLSFRASLGYSLGSGPNEVLLSLALNLIWGILLLLSLFFFLRWIAAGASVWIETASTNRALRYICLIGLLIAAMLFIVLMGNIFYVKDILEIFAVTLWTNPTNVISRISDSSFTLIFLITLWAFPLAAWFWRKRVGATLDWAFLDSFVPKPILSRQPSLRPGLAMLLGFIGGVLFSGLMGVILLLLHLGLPDSVRDTSEAKDIFLKGEFALAILMQLAIAIVIVIWAKRIGWVHGLFAAFITSCVMTIGALGLLQLGYCVSLFSFGPGHTCAEHIVAQLAGFFSNYIVNLGALLITPVVVGVSMLAEWVRRL
ncbi:MAG TPA: M56 family metallopeptidase [Anaerolineales bacterium]|nr:M56 family metallopeptidase [Anaerolineales bacterium]HLO34402.1 M56 family metallopeptidase [Anaerolineales bacterium]